MSNSADLTGRSTMRAFTAPAVLLALVLTGCDRAARTAPLPAMASLGFRHRRRRELHPRRGSAAADQGRLRG
jgi:hypothetical protein